MKPFPVSPSAEKAPDELFDGGHLWILEKLDGDPLRFQLLESGVVRFGDRDRVFEPDDVPLSYQHAVRHVRERLDRSALRAGAEDVESIAFFGMATHKRRIEYDWNRIPSFVGCDVWSAEKERFLQPDAVEKAFPGVGLTPINAFEKEVRAVDFDPRRYEIPDSAWYDGPAAGVVIRNKTGSRAELDRPLAVAEPEPLRGTEGELIEALVTDERIRGAVADLKASNTSVTEGSLFERTLEAIVRVEHDRLFHPRSDVDVRSFRSEVARATGRWLAENERELARNGR